MYALLNLVFADVINDWKSAIENVLMRSAFNENHRVPLIFTNVLIK